MPKCARFLSQHIENLLSLDIADRLTGKFPVTVEIS